MIVKKKNELYLNTTLNESSVNEISYNSIFLINRDYT